jgi:hypothetical protein
MKLSDAVAFLNLLDTVDVNPDRVEAIRGLAAILQAVTGYQHSHTDYNNRLTDNFREIKQGLDHFAETVTELKDQVLVNIQQRESEYLQNSLRIYQSEMIHESTAYILNRQLKISDIDRTYLESRLRILSDWKYPGMVIRPGLENFIKIMVPLDPLYLVDQSLDLLEPSITDFDSLYQRRVRQYTVNDYRSTPVLEKLPNNQFGLVFAYNFFNYKPLPVIERYLKEIFEKLRPGGTVILTYNNCDRAHGVRLTENNFMTYTPLRLLLPIVEQLGYVNVSNRHCEGDADILEIRRPGDLSTIRGGQSLAKIIVES